MQTIIEVNQKLKCGQNLFRKPLIEKLMAEVEQLASERGIDLEAAAVVALQPIQPVDYVRPTLTPKEKGVAEQDARKLIVKYGMGNVPKIIGALAVENVRLVKEINEHRAARGIDPLPVFEV